jgi:hypothetical protein
MMRSRRAVHQAATSGAGLPRSSAVNVGLPDA